ncbi:MAG: hypothetical protein QNK32_01950 [Porticoccus sp.]|nr:hypothetical protein [Porticoccus sp.]
MSTTSCSGVITEHLDGYVKCSTGWEVVPDPGTIADLSSVEVDLLAAAVIGLFVAAFIGKFLIRMLTTPPGRA